MMDPFILTPGQLTLDDCRQCLRHHRPIKLVSDAHEAIEASCALVQKVVAEDQTVYGINTGFGLLANTRIDKQELALLQKSIVLSHAAGIGELMSEPCVRLLMLLKINSLARGYSGIRLQVIEALITLYNAQILPAIPVKGSVGASGDLAPLAHMSAVLLGEGEVLINQQRKPAQEGLQVAGLTPLTLAPKEGLALLNGTQASSALTLQGLFLTECAYLSAVGIGALSVDAAQGSRVPFDKRIHAVRGHQAQSDTAAVFCELLQNSQIGASHQGCEKVQDPYSLRCQPQVMGAVLQQLRFAAQTLETEANGVSDNPLVFADDEVILSGGNFHAETVAMTADNLAIALSEIGALSERRMALLIDSSLSGLPAFLVDNGGVNSGFMIAQVTAAALASENKTLAHPASIDSLPTSANQEDHVSMATFAGRRLSDIFSNVSGILAIEWLAAAQGIDFRSPLKTSAPLEQLHGLLRKNVRFYDRDRYFAPDIETSARLISEQQLADLVNQLTVTRLFDG